MVTRIRNGVVEVSPEPLPQMPDELASLFEEEH